MTSLAIDLLEDGENEEGSGEESEDSELNQGAILFTPDKEKKKGGRKTGALWSQRSHLSVDLRSVLVICVTQSLKLFTPRSPREVDIALY